MPRSTPAPPRTLLLLAAAAFLLTRFSRPQRAGVRLHVERLQQLSPIEQFAPMPGNRALLDPDHWPFAVRIVAHRDGATGRLTLVPIDDRVIAGWLA